VALVLVVALAVPALAVEGDANGPTSSSGGTMVPGEGWNGLSMLFDAAGLTWQIYGDAGDKAAGNPCCRNAPV